MVNHEILRVYDPPMCCSTGVCGPEVDPALTRFAADVDWLGRRGVTVERYNPAQEPRLPDEPRGVRGLRAMIDGSTHTARSAA